MREFGAIILAAGRGKRMRSELPKVLYSISGKEMVNYVIELVQSLGIQKVAVVVGYKAQMVKEHLPDKIELVRQTKLLGTADAVKRALGRFSNRQKHLLILYADTPLLKKETIKRLIMKHRSSQASCTILTANLEEPQGYGRVVRDAQGKILKISEDLDASGQERGLTEVNAGVYCFKRKGLTLVLLGIKPLNKKREYYLTDAIETLAKENGKLESLFTKDGAQIIGVNSTTDLLQAQTIMRQRILKGFISKGVVIIDPESTFIDSGVKIGKDTIIYPHTVIERDVKIGKHCSLGPFSRIRSGTVLKDEVKIGNFVEISRCIIGKATKVKHFCYLGDARIGREVNIGAGTVTANYDGKTKNVTIIEDNAFIGSGTILVAPVKVGKAAVTGAGAVLLKYKDVPASTVVVGVPARVLKKV